MPVAMRFGVSSKSIMLFTGVVVILAIIVLVAAKRQPVPDHSGTAIHAPERASLFEEGTIRISTFNIHRGKNIEGENALLRIAEILKEDIIIGLQEVYGNVLPFSKNQAQLIADETRSAWLFDPSQRRFFRDYSGNALLTRIPILTWESMNLPREGEGDVYPRSRRFSKLLKVETTLWEQPVTLFVTHLDPGGIKHSQLQFVLSEFDQTDRAILMGDLNLVSQHPELRSWLEKNKGSDAINQALGKNDLSDRVDWILIRGFKVLTGGSRMDTVSDHPYFWVSLALAK